jgi:acetylornithine deacetylase/succinyl-diaminopimelate desuccinylase-like protein
MDKHSTYYTVLDALKAAKECPLCALEAGAIHGYFDAILYEAVNDPKVRAELVRSKGYCHRHAHYLTDMRDSFGIAILYQDQLQLFKDVLAKGVLVDSDNGVSIMGRYGIPCIGFGPGHEEEAHAPNEKTWKSELVKAAAMYAAIPMLFIEKYAKEMPRVTANLAEKG